MGSSSAPWHLRGIQSPHRSLKHRNLQQTVNFNRPQPPASTHHLHLDPCALSLHPSLVFSIPESDMICDRPGQHRHSWHWHWPRIRSSASALPVIRDTELTSYNLSRSLVHSMHASAGAESIPTIYLVCHHVLCAPYPGHSEDGGRSVQLHVVLSIIPRTLHSHQLSVVAIHATASTRRGIPASGLEVHREAGEWYIVDPGTSTP
ncbi:hypothetical protein C8Q80DRAFT_371743 [Daedaleopsis nitida]|nr:hypothetical protein C8Q80DRAFT_371743 [Daedaleopsis nitida]